MKEITLEDLKEEINNNLWQITKLDSRKLGYGVTCYLRFGEEQVMIIIVMENKANVLLYISKEELENGYSLFYQSNELYKINFDKITIIKRLMKKEVFELLQSQDIPF